ncbi:MAG TPA: hypothetical protein VMT52_03670 [Planctomycetota bacterium]|nr:hypothetical protein [Planctomycetota bacterium]
MDTGLSERDGALWWGDVAFIPSIHGRMAFAREARRVFLARRFPTVAVELPESLAEKTIEGIEALPGISAVSYEEAGGTRCFFPIDPCDSIVEALRLGHGENAALEFIDRDVEDFQRVDVVLPDSYAVGSIGLPRFYQTVLPALPAVLEGSQDDEREEHMAWSLLSLLQRGPRRLPILCVLGMTHLRGVVRRLDEEARARKSSGTAAGTRIASARPPGPPVPPPLGVELHGVSRDSLYHVLGELPYTTHLYEQHRASFSLDEVEAVDTMKKLLLEARDRHHEKHPEEYERISIASFQNLLQFIRNLCLAQRRLTPSLYEMAVAARGIAGSEFAIQVIETAKRYPPAEEEAEKSEGDGELEEGGEGGGEGSASQELELESVDVTEEAMRLGGEAVPAKKRVVGEAKEWKKLRLEPPPHPKDIERWRTAWNPYETCSWTPEDVIVENFAGHVRRRALLESGIAQERLEEFRTSLKDGIHVRETLRHLHLGKIIVKETPTVQGQVGAVVIIYGAPDPEKYPWKLTWLPEYEWESILAFYATRYEDDLVGPGIGRATYGGQLFLRATPLREDVWKDSRFDDARDDAERLVFAGLDYTRDRFVAYVAPSAPSPRMKERASRLGKKLLYLPLSSFSRTTLGKLRRFHVLNGKPVRSYARQFIR